MRGKTALLGIALMVLCAAVIGNVTAQLPEESTDKLIHVSGTGKVTTTPDQAIILFAVETENADVTTAQQENARRMDTVINALKNAGIPAKDIKTAGYNIIPVTESDDKLLTDSRVKYYRVINTVEVTLNDVDRAGEIVDLAVENGANRVDRFAFTLSDAKQQQFRSQALTAAVAQARGDADAVVAALGKTIIEVKEVNVGNNYIPMVYDGRLMSMEKAAGSAAPTPLEAGEIDVTASVSISYIIS
ncbi:MAG: SIMPL domain-containing protein [Methanoculleus sp.]|uniref:SIMPL domain-containing protein n=1 Tax=Methanoculleus sp. TaxID=90427 RepID=UPI0025DEB566|nr:SIMPL domain-containing protein [Methanoculleus sp.]MCK9318376.1 SIMPL domain-containing protein [Methanoculleus sp.]MDD3217234.1 SIMPL domain-containing protein [Methanoculleus sp.]MDD4315198.1 SIMPL domain-containing protein [Methanoculleus sp.]MDD4471802.1 SIMPL domain-containing protein [Methanoculleus sp.]